jgi:hypothetical protein
MSGKRWKVMDHEKRTRRRKRWGEKLERRYNKGRKPMEKSRIKRANLWKTGYTGTREGKKWIRRRI